MKRGCLHWPLRWLYFRVYQWRYPPPVLPSDPALLSPIFRLPQDVLHYIANSNAIPLVDRAALALTCKTVWTVVDGKRILKKLARPSNMDLKDSCPEKEAATERLDLLQRLEPWIPSHLLCHHCVTYHRRRPRRRGFTHCDAKSRLIGAWRLVIGDWALVPYLVFSRAQEVMNYHRCGPDYGCPTADLEENIAHGLPYINGGCRERRSVTIVNNELLLKVDRSSLFLRSWPPQSEFWAAERNWRSCLFDYHFSRSWATANIFDSLDISKKEVRTFLCAECQGEFRLIIDPHYSKRCGELRLTAWVNMGSCRSPFDPKWSSRKPWYWLHTKVRELDPTDAEYIAHFDDLSPQKIDLSEPPWFAVLGQLVLIAPTILFRARPIACLDDGFATLFFGMACAVAVYIVIQIP